MDVSADRIIERYAQELASVQQQLFIAQAIIAEYEANKNEAPVEATN